MLPLLLTVFLSTPFVGIRQENYKGMHQLKGAKSARTVGSETIRLRHNFNNKVILCPIRKKL